jgi:predicted enzyme related to lactoylglutathione lyase
MKLHSAVFYSKDLDSLLSFYEKYLGAKIENRQGNRFMYARLADNSRIAIKVGNQPREVPGHQSIFLDVPNIEEWYKKALDKKVNVYKQLVQEPWGKEFSVFDPDGNKIVFYEDKD